jgi:hypothetical protein
MSQICLWDRNTLEYDGCCSHCCLREMVVGDFELSAEDLEAKDVESKQKRKIWKQTGNSNYHYKQMETNYDEYSTFHAEKRARLRAQDPEADNEKTNARSARTKAAGTYPCQLCKLTFGTKQKFNKHFKSAKHLGKADELANRPHKCLNCAVAFDYLGNYQRHLKAKCHLEKMAALSSSELD